MNLPILVTLDRAYIPPLKVMLFSLRQAHPKTRIRVYVMQSDFDAQDKAQLERFTNALKLRVQWVSMDDHELSTAPTLLHYTKAMYYRLFAHRCLPPSLKRVLYIDPDTVILNRLDALMELDLQGKWFAAAYHDIAPRTLNQMRLYPYAIQQYYNSGVLVMDLGAQRRHLQVHDILQFVQTHKNRLIMPDQDILNALYADRILTLDERRFNYDARYFNYYRLKSGGEWDMQRVLKDCSILHFCGKRKPWHASYRGRFLPLYLHIEKQAQALEATLTASECVY